MVQYLQFDELMLIQLYYLTQLCGLHIAFPPVCDAVPLTGTASHSQTAQPQAHSPSLSSLLLDLHMANTSPQIISSACRVQRRSVLNPNLASVQQDLDLQVDRMDLDS